MVTPSDESFAVGNEATDYLVKGQRLRAGSEALQPALASIYDTAERPRCMCVPGGVEMYVAKYGDFIVKRIPDTGADHHAGCVHFEPLVGESGLGSLLGSGITARESGYDFRLAHALRSVPRRAGEATPATATVREPRSAPGKISLRAMTHLLWQQAGIDRWVPAMQGKRNWGVLRYRLSECARLNHPNTAPLADILLMAKPFKESEAAGHAAARATFLASCTQPDRDGVSRKVIVLGELKSATPVDSGDVRVLLKHMSEQPFLADQKIWKRVQKVYRPLLKAKAVDDMLRLVVTAIVSAQTERVYRIDALSLILTTENWIPVESAAEAELIRALVAAGRSFYKPLAFASNPAMFPGAVLRDSGPKRFNLEVISAFEDEKTGKLRMASIKDRGSKWIWTLGEAMPPLPPRIVPPRSPQPVVG